MSGTFYDRATELKNKIPSSTTLAPFSIPSLTMQTKPNFSLRDIDRLGELLAEIPDPSLPMEPDMLDGFLVAIALMKTPPALSDWLPLVLDQYGKPVRLPSAKMAELRTLILKRGKFLEHSILNATEIDPIIYEDEETDEPFAPLAPFSDGFSFACSLWPELINSKESAVQAALVGILRYETCDTQEDSDLRSGIEQEVQFADLDEALADLCACVEEIACVTRTVKPKSRN